MSFVGWYKWQCKYNLGVYKMDKNNTEKLLAVKCDKELTLDYHVSDSCKNAGGKISPLAKVTP